MTNAEIDALERQVDGLIRKLDSALGIDTPALSKARHRRETHTIDHSDDGDTWSADGADYADAPASDPSADAETDGGADDNNNLDGADDGDDDEEEEDNTVARKFSNTYHLNQHNAADRPGELDSSTHPSSSSSRHKFEALVDKIKNDQGIPRSAAMAYARMQFPDVYRSYQQHVAPSASYSKRAVATFEDLVSAEMRKGVNAEVAGQRVAQLHGYPALRHRAMTKRAAVADFAEARLVSSANNIWSNDPELSCCESLRKSRLAHPALYRALRNI